MIRLVVPVNLQSQLGIPKLFTDTGSTYETQKNNWTSIHPGHYIENKSRATRIKALNYQRKNSGVVFQPSYYKIGYSCKSAVAVGNSKIIYRYWKTTYETQKNN